MRRDVVNGVEANVRDRHSWKKPCTILDFIDLPWNTSDVDEAGKSKVCIMISANTKPLMKQRPKVQVSTVFVKIYVNCIDVEEESTSRTSDRSLGLPRLIFSCHERLSVPE
jgi:hypothetical protein